MFLAPLPFHSLYLILPLLFLPPPRLSIYAYVASTMKLPVPSYEMHLGCLGIIARDLSDARNELVAVLSSASLISAV